MIPALRQILSSTPFAGLGVFFTSLDQAEPMQLHLALASPVPLDLAPVIEHAAAALNMTPFGA